MISIVSLIHSHQQNIHQWMDKRMNPVEEESPIVSLRLLEYKFDLIELDEMKLPRTPEEGEER